MSHSLSSMVTLAIAVLLACPANAFQIPTKRGVARLEDWTTQPWTKTAPELEAIKKKAELLVQSKSTAQLVSLATAAKADYKKAPSALGLFRWLTYSYEGGRWTMDKRFGDDAKNFPAESDLHRHGLEYSGVYIYARMRFIREATLTPSSSLFQAGKRLYAKDSKDRDVKLALMRMCSARSVEEEALGRKFTGEMLASHPDDAMVLFNGGRFHWSVWWTKRRKDDWEKSIALNKRFIGMAPAGFESVRVAKSRIEMMEKHGYRN